MKWTIPNILTVARLIAVPLLPLAYLIFDRPTADWLAVVIFVVASLTDYLDGYLARALKLESLFGAAMDPIADKALVLIALLLLTGYGGLTAWIILPAAAIVYREVFVSGLRETLGDKARALKVTKLAKWKTASQMVAITLLFAKGVLEYGGKSGDVWVAGLGVLLLWVAGVLTVITGWDYFQKALPFLREDPDA